MDVVFHRQPAATMNQSINNLPSETGPARNRRLSGWLSVLPGLLTPICIGLAFYVLLAWAIKENHIADQSVLRYLTGHPVSKVTVGMFFIGAASLILIAYNIFEQFSAERSITLMEIDSQRSPDPSDPDRQRTGESITRIEEEIDRSVEHGEQLLRLPRWMHTHYLWNRLVKTLHYIYRNGSVSGVQEEMKYLAELDLERSHQRYSLVRILIWATPMLGFLGTVLGISQALGGISVGEDNNFQAMMNGLQSNLYVAFDTTALALTLSMVLMFAQFLVERFEVQLLQVVDQRTGRTIAQHYDMTMSSTANGSFEKIGREVLEATRDVVTNQTKIWKQSIRAAEQAWTASLTQTSGVVQTGLSEALEENVAHLADYLGQAIEKADQSVAHRWEQWQTMLSSNARLMNQHQQQMIAQTQSVSSLVGKLDESTSLQKALDQQQAAIQATSDMHEVLAKVAREIQTQGGQLKHQTRVQAGIVKQTAALIEKSAQSYQAQKRQLDQTQQRIINANANATDQHQQPDPSPTKRRRDPNKPVMFIRSEAVTAIRNQTEGFDTRPTLSPHSETSTDTTPNDSTRHDVPTISIEPLVITPPKSHFASPHSSRSQFSDSQTEKLNRPRTISIKALKTQRNDHNLTQSQPQSNAQQPHRQPDSASSEIERKRQLLMQRLGMQVDPNPPQPSAKPPQTPELVIPDAQAMQQRRVLMQRLGMRNSNTPQPSKPLGKTDSNTNRVA